MKLSSLIFTSLLCIAVFLSYACNEQSETLDINIDSIASEKHDYELAEVFLNQLKQKKADTIIFYQRTCIGCCDFYNFFWMANNQRFLTRIYFDFDDRKSYAKTIPLTSNKIFEVLNMNYSELKLTTIKENEHKHRNRISHGMESPHYCYAQASIYTNQDSILSDRIKDHSFNKYSDGGIMYDRKEKRLIPMEDKDRSTNDNYSFNINSKWNIFLITIENEISNMPGTTKRELDELRIRKTED